MDIQRASEILELDMINIVDAEYVRKRYRCLALQYHPDKNDNSPESTEKFKQINEAYHYLKNINDRKTQSSAFMHDTTYADLLSLFIQSVITRSNNEPFINIVKDVLGNCKQLSMSMFEGLDKSIIIEVYEFMSKYKHILHVSCETLDELKRIVVEKCKNDQIYILNPKINDLFEGSVYKLVIDEKTYYVPLWHAETYFDGGTGQEIVVKCIPELPENIVIDENNNVCIYVSIKLFSELLQQEYIIVPIYTNKSVQIKVSELKLIQKQKVVLRCEGIYRINESIPYDTGTISDVIVILTFTQ